MSLAIVKKVRAKYPTPLGNKHALFLIEVSQAIKGSGLLKKTSGTRITLPKEHGSVQVAQDIICLRRGAEVDHYDILKDGEGEAKPTWNLVGPIDPARFVDVSLAPIPVPKPIPEPTPQPPDVLTVLAGMRAEIQARFDRVDAGLEELAADHRKTRKVTGSAGWLGTIDGEISGVE